MCAALDDLGDGLLVLCALDELMQAGVLGSQDKEGNAKERIVTRGDDGDLADGRLVLGDTLANRGAVVTWTLVAVVLWGVVSGAMAAGLFNAAGIV